MPDHTTPAHTASRADDYLEPSATERTQVIRLRRGVGYLLASALLPGSVQLVAGNRRLGVIALRTLGVVWAVIVLTVVGILIARGAVVTVLTTGWILKIAQPLLWVLGAGWVLLFLDSLRLARPATMTKRGGVATSITAVVVAAAVGFASISLGSIARAQGDLLGSVLGGGGNAKHNDGRINVLLLGGDAGADRQGLRPDSITVASIDAETGRTVLFSLPRNLEDVDFPASSPLHALYPDGYSCEDHSCLLNAVYTLGVEHKDLYPGVKDPGVQATQEAVEQTLGLKINYWSMIDLAGFTSLVDAVGGITLDINRRVPIGGGTSPIFGYIEPGKAVHLDGYHALWFARSREGSSDFERMARQKCVMNAMLNQLNPATVVLKFNDVAAAGEEIAATNVNPSDVNMLIDLAQKAKAKPISSVAFTPPLIYPGNPKLDVIRSTVKATIAKSEALDDPRAKSSKAAPKAPASKSPSSKSTASKSPASKAPASTAQPTSAAPQSTSPAEDNGTPQPTTDDLGAVCSVS